MKNLLRTLLVSAVVLTPALALANEPGSDDPRVIEYCKELTQKLKDANYKVRVECSSRNVSRCWNALSERDHARQDFIDAHCQETL